MPSVSDVELFLIIGKNTFDKDLKVLDKYFPSKLEKNMVTSKRYVEFDGGWHFTFLMNVNEISNKLIRFNHEINHLHKGEDFNSKKLLDKKEIKKRILNLTDPYERNDIKLRKVEIDNTYPEFVRNNINLFSDYII